MLSPAAWREAARRVLGTHGARTALDTSGLSIPQAALVSSLTDGRFDLLGTVTYRCATCSCSATDPAGLITKPWQVFYVDLTPGSEWASYIAPLKPSKSMTTHHDWHMASGGD